MRSPRFILRVDAKASAKVDLTEVANRAAEQTAPVARLPLNAWQEYAHALLLTNEAAFVN